MPHISFRKGKLAYTDKGKGRVLILLHGFLGNKELWSYHASVLSKKYRVITIDLPGHGKSDELGYIQTMELFAEALHELISHLKIRKLVLIGHSLGAYVALAFAEKFPDAILGLIMMNSTAKGDSDARKKSRDQLVRLVKKDRNKALEMLVPNFFNVKSRSMHWKVKRYLKAAKMCSSKAIVATIEGMKIRKEREIILHFSPFPYLYFIGEFDAVFPPADLIEESQLNAKGGYIYFERSSHMIYLEEDARSIKKIRQFIAKL